MINPLNLTFNAGDLLHASSLNSMVGKINELVSVINEVSLNNPGGNTDPITATNLSFKLIGVATIDAANENYYKYIPNDSIWWQNAGISVAIHVYDADTQLKIDSTTPTSADWSTYFPSGASILYREWFDTNYGIKCRTYSAENGESRRDITQENPITKKSNTVQIYNVPTIYDVLSQADNTKYTSNNSSLEQYLKSKIVDRTAIRAEISTLGLNRHPEKYLWGSSDNYLLGNEINSGLCIPGNDPEAPPAITAKGSITFNANDVPKVDGGLVTLVVNSTDDSSDYIATGDESLLTGDHQPGQMGIHSPYICLERDLVLMSMWFVVRKLAMDALNKKWSDFCENPRFFICSDYTKEDLSLNGVNENLVNVDRYYVSDFGKHYVPDNNDVDSTPYRAYSIMGRYIDLDQRSIRKTNVTRNITLQKGDIFVVLRKEHVSNTWPAFVELTIPETADLSVGNLGKWILPWQISTSTPTDPNENLLLALGITNYDYLTDNTKENTNPNAHWFGWNWYPNVTSFTVPKEDEDGYCLWEGSNGILYRSLGSYPKLVIDPNGHEHDTGWKIDGLTNKCYIRIGNSEIELTRKEDTYSFGEGKSLCDITLNLTFANESLLLAYNAMVNLTNRNPNAEIALYHSYLDLIYWPYEDVIDNFSSNGTQFFSNGRVFNTNKYVRYGGTNYQITAFEANKTIEISTIRFSDWRVPEYDYDDGEV